MKYLFFIPALIILLGCPAPQEEANALPRSIHIQVEDHWTNTATIKMWVAHSTEPWRFTLQRNDSTVMSGYVEGKDTIFTEYGLSEVTDYFFVAQLMEDSEVIDYSDTLHVRTHERSAFLGFEGSWVPRMVLSNERLYAGVSELGLHLLDTSLDTLNWEYLGLSHNDPTSRYSIRDILIDADESQKILVSGRVGTSNLLYRSIDGGATWELAGEYGPNHPQIDKFQTSNGKVIGWGPGGQYFSYDFGETWIRSQLPLPPFSFLDRVDGFEKCAYNDDYLWFSAHHWWGVELFRTQNGGDEWDRIPWLDEYQFGNVSSIAPHPRNRNIIYIVLGGNLYKCIDGGDEWVQDGINYSETLNDSSRTVLLDPRFPDRMYLSKLTRLFVSNDAGGNWDQIIINLPPERYIYTMVLDAEQSVLYLGTSSGVYKVRVDKLAQF